MRLAVTEPRLAEPGWTGMDRAWLGRDNSRVCFTSPLTLTRISDGACLARPATVAARRERIRLTFRRTCRPETRGRSSRAGDGIPAEGTGGRDMGNQMACGKDYMMLDRARRSGKRGARFFLNGQILDLVCGMRGNCQGIRESLRGALWSLKEVPSLWARYGESGMSCSKGMLILNSC